MTAAARDLSAQMEKSNEKEAPAVAAAVSLAEPPEANSIEISDFIEHDKPMDEIEMAESSTVEETIETPDEPIEMVESSSVEEIIETPDEPMDNIETAEPSTVEKAIERADVALESSDDKIEVKPSKVKGSRKKVASATTPKEKKATTKMAKNDGAGEKKMGKKTPKESTEEREVVVSTTPDWSSLSESTLKRKTVKDLAAYLETKGVDIMDTKTGKILKKDNLVELVLVST